MTDMSSLTCGGFCCVFCCPPCPSTIASKLAFLPPEPTYSVSTFDGGFSYQLHLSERAEFQYGQRELECIEVIKTKTKIGNRVVVMFVRCAPPQSSCILFSHGNAVDLGQMASFFVSLGTRLGVNVCSYDYSGYGFSEGKPSESNLYHDIDATYLVLRTKFGVQQHNILLYGQSIGSVPTIDLATRYKVGAVVLHSPLTSGLRVACPENRRTYCCDSFANIDKVKDIRSPVLVIHGTDDEVIDFSHGLEIYDQSPITVEPLWVECAGHHDIELFAAYIKRMKKLVNEELPNLRKKNYDGGS